MWEPRRFTTLCASTAFYKDSFTFLPFTRRYVPGDRTLHGVPHYVSILFLIRRFGNWICFHPQVNEWRDSYSVSLDSQSQALNLSLCSFRILDLGQSQELGNPDAIKGVINERRTP
jgi:hypothetical protein